MDSWATWWRRRNLWLFYTNRRPEDAAFLHEMRALAAVMPAFHVATATAAEGIDASWTGVRGALPCFFEAVAAHEAAVAPLPT